jgi:peptidoglycan/LPS O-acetylase OafA/YrhL
MAERDLYIDRLRTVMTALVVVFHAAITYGGSGGWFGIRPSNCTLSVASLLC